MDEKGGSVPSRNEVLEQTRQPGPSRRPSWQVDKHAGHVEGTVTRSQASRSSEHQKLRAKTARRGSKARSTRGTDGCCCRGESEPAGRGAEAVRGRRQPSSVPSVWVATEAVALMLPHWAGMGALQLRTRTTAIPAALGLGPLPAAYARRSILAHQL